MKHQPNAKRIERDVDGSVTDVTPIVPVAKWGRDHWTTLLYIETRCVDYKGVIGNDHMRTNARVHRKLLGEAQTRFGVTGSSPTILRNGDELDRHDDWSCVEEMVAHGLVAMVKESDRKPSQQFGGGEVRLALTDLGWRVAHTIRRDRAEGKPTVRWQPKPELEAEIRGAFEYLSASEEQK